MKKKSQKAWIPKRTVLTREEANQMRAGMEFRQQLERERPGYRADGSNLHFCNNVPKALAEAIKRGFMGEAQ